MTLERRPALYRWLMLATAGAQLTVSAWALLDPRAFHEDFPGAGHHWLPVLGPFNEHMVVDYGSFTLTGCTALVIGAILLHRSAVQVALGAWLVGNIPHLAYHVATAGRFETADAVANLAALSLYVAVPLVLLPGTRRRSGAKSP